MPVAVIIREASEAPQLVKWALLFARARDSDLLILNPVIQPDTRVSTAVLAAEAEEEKPSLAVNAVRNAVRELTHVTLDEPAADQRDDDDAESSPGDGPTGAQAPTLVRMKVLYHPDATLAVLDEITASEIDLLILPRHTPLEGEDAGKDPGRQLFRRAPCETLVLRPGMNHGADCRRVLVPCARGPHCGAALRAARDVVSTCAGQIDALYVEPNVGIDAELVGRRILDKLLSRALDDNADVNRLVVVANKVHTGIASAYQEQHDLVLMGASKQGVVRRMLFGTVSESLMKQPEGPAIAVVRASIPVTNQLQQSLEHALQRLVPQLERRHRVELVERVQSNSQWDFDFITLLCLSTLIATLGLVQDSTAVVIGAMLVAPLMTPLLGVGLALVQGNQVLIVNAARAVLLGFVLAFLIALLLGLSIPAFDNLTTQMLQRTAPGFLDLIIAFASGLAAAYATSRPSLLAALPGVAIAAALLPPIATAGLAIAIGQPIAALGASLLFLTNMVAIVFGAAVAIWSVGVRSAHQHSRAETWTAIGAGALLIATIALAVGLNSGRLGEQAQPLPEQLVGDIERHIEQTPGANIVSIKPGRAGPPKELIVTVAAETPASQQLADELASIAKKHYQTTVHVRVETGLIRESKR